MVERLAQRWKRENMHREDDDNLCRWWAKWWLNAITEEIEREEHGAEFSERVYACGEVGRWLREEAKR